MYTSLLSEMESLSLILTSTEIEADAAKVSVHSYQQK